MQLKLSTSSLVLALGGCCLDVAGSTSGTTTSSAPETLVLSCVTDGVARDGGSIALQDAGNDPRCPGEWSNVTNGEDPEVCDVNGLICTFPEGQAECAHDGQPLEWWPIMRQRGCRELAPPSDAGCCSPGLTCPYITGPPHHDLSHRLLLRRHIPSLGPPGQLLSERQYLRHDQGLRL